jgi:hypothetical protein
VSEAIPVLGPVYIDQPNIRLVHECRGLERLAWGLLSQLLRSQFAQLVVDQGQQLPGGVRVALFDGGQDARDFGQRRTPTFGTRLVLLDGRV